LHIGPAAHTQRLDPERGPDRKLEGLIGRNHALLRAAAARAYKLLISDEVGEAVLAAYTARLRAQDLLRRRLRNRRAA